MKVESEQIQSTKQQTNQQILNRQAPDPALRDLAVQDDSTDLKVYQSSQHLAAVRSVHLESWPTYNDELTKSAQVTIVVQVNGKLRGELTISADEQNDQESIITAAKTLEKIKPWIADKEIVKEIYVKGKLVSLVVR